MVGKAKEIKHEGGGDPAVQVLRTSVETLEKRINSLAGDLQKILTVLMDRNTTQ